MDLDRDPAQMSDAERQADLRALLAYGAFRAVLTSRRYSEETARMALTEPRLQRHEWDTPTPRANADVKEYPTE